MKKKEKCMKMQARRSSTMQHTLRPSIKFGPWSTRMRNSQCSVRAYSVLGKTDVG